MIEYVDVLLERKDPLEMVKETPGFNQVNTKIAAEHLEKQEIGTFLIRETNVEAEGMRKQLLLSVREEKGINQYSIFLRTDGYFVYYGLDGQAVIFDKFNSDNEGEGSLMHYLKEKNIISKPSEKIDLNPYLNQHQLNPYLNQHQKGLSLFQMFMNNAGKEHELRYDKID